MVKAVIHSYADLPVHKIIGELIRKHSENSEDIRHVAQALVDWTRIRTVLDCGCGYGWFENALNGPFDQVVGVDCLDENREQFLAVARRIAGNTAFMNLLLPAPIRMPSRHFDCIVCAYSLYFFPEALPEIKRVLHPEGVFLVITHSESMLEEAERFFDFKNLKQVIRGFSSENGESILKRYFTRVACLDYQNTLVFEHEHGEDLSLYIDFKKEFIAKDVAPELVKKTMIGELDRHGSVRFNKNDRIFAARI